jgi:hypothetical protein
VAEFQRFALHRDTDHTGVSGTGRKAEGCRFTDGTVVLRWLTGASSSTVVWPDIAAAWSIHGHDGATRFVFEDGVEWAPEDF